MRKILLLQEYLPHYRVDIFNELAKYVDLSVVYSKGKLPDGVNFKTIFIETIRIHWKFHKKNIYNLAKNFDGVLCMFDTAFFDYRLLSLLPHKYKVIYWGIGVLFDKDRRYDGDYNTHPAIMNAMRRSDATIFYCDYPVRKYAALGIDINKLFVANNTVKVLSINKDLKRENILFMGSLYKEKRIHELLENYFDAYKICNNIPKLIIVGEGIEYQSIQAYIYKNNLQENILLEGGVYEEEQIRNYFSSSLVCISPNQAGLSVLKAMGYGVPYITLKNAITGGELFNIIHNETGVLFEQFTDLKDIILDVSKNQNKYLEMGEKAKQYYDSFRKVEDMVQGFLDAIEYTFKNKVK